jgi:hypothetical protein
VIAVLAIAMLGMAAAVLAVWVGVARALRGK